MSAKNVLAFAALSLLLAGRSLAIGEDEFLDPTEAFKYTATADESTAGRDAFEVAVVLRRMARHDA